MPHGRGLAATAAVYDERKPRSVRWDLHLSASIVALAITGALLPVSANAQVVANPGDNINVDGQNISTNANNTPALHALGTGIITGTGTTATTSGINSEGALATAGGQIMLTNSSISTTNGALNGAYAVHTVDAGSSITITNTIVTTQQAHGVAAEGGSITINGGSITTFSVGAEALLSSALLTATGTTITTNGPFSVGAFSIIGGNILLTNSTIQLNGANSAGLVAARGVLTMNGGSITSTQDGATGAWSGSIGGARIDMTGVTVQLQGAGGPGLRVSDGSEITFTNGSVTMQGAGSFALLTDGIGTNTLNISGSTVTAPAGATIGVLGTHGVINITSGSTVTGGTGGLMLVDDVGGTPGVANLTADNSTLTGNIIVDGAAANSASIILRNNATLTGNINVDATNGASADLAVQSGASFTGATQDVSSVTMSGGTWNVTADSNVTGLLANAGMVAFQWGGAFHTLTTANYVGNGGTINFNAALAGDGSPADQLIIDSGTATGNTGVLVTNRGGAGAMTTGNGIAIVVAQNGGTTAAGAFHLAGPVAAGPFQYFLFRGPQGAGTADDQNTWYLRSHVLAATVTGPGPAFPPGGGGVPIPLYRPETASYALFPALARGLAVSTIGSFHERNGDQALAAGSKRERMWGRIFGEHSEHSHGGHVTPSFEGHAAGFQAGADVYETVWDNGVRGRTGLFVGWAETRGDIKGFVLGNLEAFAGDAQLEATSVGGYGTLIGPGGWYLDGIVMPSFYSGDGKSTNGIGVNADGWSLLGSLEAGMPLRIGGGLTLEPQAQLIYQHLDFDDAADPFSTVRFRTPDAVSGRIGVRLAAELAQGRVRPYLKANIWQDWLDKDGVIYAGTHRLDTEHGGTALEVGGGLVAELMPGVGVWGMIDYTTDIAGDTEREALRGNAGVRITW